MNTVNNVDKPKLLSIPEKSRHKVTESKMYFPGLEGTIICLPVLQAIHFKNLIPRNFEVISQFLSHGFQYFQVTKAHFKL